VANGSLTIVLGMGLEFGRNIGEWPRSLRLLVPLAALCVLGAAIWVVSAPLSGPRRRRRRGAAVALAVVGAFLLVVAGCPVGPFSFGSTAICRVCGALQYESHSTLIPFVTVTHFKQTDLSEFAWSAGLVGSHEHQWLFAHGGGGGITASGPALELIFVPHEDAVREFLAATIKWQGVAEAKEWLRVILTPGGDGDPQRAVQWSWNPRGATDRARYEHCRKEALDTLRSDFPELALPAGDGRADSPAGL
jgi:hypothetical protein